MRSFSLPLPTLFAGFVAVLVGYASSAAIIWQAAAAAGSRPILVLTGKGAKTQADPALPAGTLVFPDLAAVAAQLSA